MCGSACLDERMMNARRRLSGLRPSFPVHSRYAMLADVAGACLSAPVGERGMRTFGTASVLAAGLVITTSSIAAAQDLARGSATRQIASDQAASPTPSAEPAGSQPIVAKIANDFRHLASVENGVIVGVAAGLALALRPEDAELTRRAVINEPLEEAFDGGSPIGSGWAQAGAALGTYAIGRLSSKPKAQAVGGDLLRAQLVSGVVTQALKYSFGRTRPDGSSHSFPSGHASASFATATVLERQLGWKVGVAAYAAAAYVAGSRLSENKHYASDVIFGAAVGIVAGRSVTVGRGAHRFAVSPVAVHGGAAVMFVRVGP
jgi:hypothetical protein